MKNWFKYEHLSKDKFSFIFSTLQHSFLQMLYISLLREDKISLFIFLQKLKGFCSIMQGADINIYI